MSRKQALIAAHRFGLGPRPGEINLIASDPRGWLIEQLEAAPRTPEAMQDLPPAADNVLDWWAAVSISVAELVRRIRTDYRDLWRREAKARLAAAITSEQPFRERLVWFWGNHFTVSGRKAVVIGMAGAHEREAVRPYVSGRFRDMLHHAVSHPGMLFYLDNYGSVGSKSKMSQVGPYRRGLNENLAREILELHTLGVKAGYTQRDVREFAKMLTGWTNGRQYHAAPGKFYFRQEFHEPGPKTVLGQAYREDGVNEGRAVLDRLATHEATARHVVTKLARHFIADEPPASAVRALSAKFLETEGDLMAVARTLVELPEAWVASPGKFKTPQEYVVGAMRAVGGEVDTNELVAVLNSFGHLPLMAPSPAGWADVAGPWLNPDSALRRARFAAALSARRQGSEASLKQIAQATIEGLAPAETLRTIAAADSPEEGLALLLASPAMQRR